MADQRGNPWNFTTADQAATASITSITRNGQGSALVQLAGVLTGLAKDLYISIQGTTILGWQKAYRIIDVGTAANSFLVAITPDQYLLANNGANGAVFTSAYHEIIEVVQMLWDGPTAATALLVTDSYGRLVWNPSSVTGSGGGGPYTYMKAFPINGLVLNTIGSGTLQISV
jgi:hypothetical protein